MLSERWYPLTRKCKRQQELFLDESRFSICHSPRRSGKTEVWKRKGVLRAHKWKSSRFRGRFAFLAPTHKQAMKIYWEDLKLLTEGLTGRGKPTKSEQMIPLWNSDIVVAGMDCPERIEGQPLDGVVLDEYANMDEDTWNLHVRPCLSTPDRLGWGAFIGVPEGRNHYYRLRNKYLEKNLGPVFHWDASEVVDPEEIESARQELSDLEFRQEYGGEFVAYGGLAYYEYKEQHHIKQCKHNYSPLESISLCLDFNVSPGVAAIVQVMSARDLGLDLSLYAEYLDCVIGEVWVPQNSNTAIVSRKFLHDWESHKAHVELDGDATGGWRGTSKLAGSDWDIVKDVLKGRLVVDDKVLAKNPPEKLRINAFNARLATADRKIHTIIDPSCKYVREDIEGTKVLEGSAGELDKSDKERTHITDALGYYYYRKYRAPKHISSEFDL